MLPFGRYQLLRKIASGGMGEVLLARIAGQQGFEKLLVIKRILPNLVEEEEFCTMFFDEARVSARLNHPNIVQIFDMGEVQGSHYLAMEYVAGDDLRRLQRHAVRKGITIPLGVTCRIIADAAAALDHAHKARDAAGKPLGLVHRDVSPQNVLVGFDGAVKLIDFGVAKAANKIQHTAAGVIKGKLSYMSPEQASGAEIDHRSDVFSLGILFWETVTGTRLFKADNEPLILQMVRECKVPRPSSINAALPPELDELILGVLKARPEDRKYDAMTLRMAIEDFCIGQRLPASSAHLVAFLETLYAERMATERDPKWLDQLEEDPFAVASRMEAGTPSGMAQVSLPQFGQQATPNPKSVSIAVPITEDSEVGVRTQMATAPPPPRGKAGLIAGLVVLCLLLAGGVYFATRPPPVIVEPVVEKPPVIAVVTPPEVVVPVPVPVVVPAVVTPDESQVQLVSDPPGARITVDGKDFGTAPLSISLAPSASRVLIFTMDRFEQKKITLTAADGPLLKVQLKKKAAKRPGVPALEIRTDR